MAKNQKKWEKKPFLPKIEKSENFQKKIEKNWKIPFISENKNLGGFLGTSRFASHAISFKIASS